VTGRNGNTARSTASRLAKLAHQGDADERGREAHHEAALHAGGAVRGGLGGERIRPGGRRRLGARRGGDRDGELHAAAAVARGAADEVVRAGLRERDLGVLVAVRLDGVAGGAGAVVRRAHLRDRTELQYY
jgi:hypothetical protein